MSGFLSILIPLKEVGSGVALVVRTVGSSLGQGIFSGVGYVFSGVSRTISLGGSILGGSRFAKTRDAIGVVLNPGGITKTVSTGVVKVATTRQTARSFRRSSQQGQPLQSAITAGYTYGIAPAIGVIIFGVYVGVPTASWIFQKLITNFGLMTNSVAGEATGFQDYVIAEKRNIKNPLIKGLWIGLELLIWAMALVISFVLMIVIAISTVLANFFLNFFIPAVVLVFLIFGLDQVQQNYRDLTNTVHNSVVNVELFLAKASTVSNAGLEIQNIFAPLANVFWDNTWRMFAVLFGTVADSDYSPSFTNFWQGDGKQTSPNPDTVGGGRRLSEEAFQDRLGQVEGPVVEIAWLMQLYNAFVLFVFRFQLMLVYPFFEVVLQVLSFVFGKIQCAIVGGAYCTVVELTQALVNLFVALLNGFISLFGASIPFVTSIACSAGELRHVSAKECGGSIADPYPFGAFFSNLRVTDSSQRRLLADHYGPLLECYQHPLDHSWIEAFEDRIIHKSHTEQCPISKMAMTGTIKQQTLVFERLKLHTDCYQLCTLGVHSLQCHFWSAENMTLTLLGSCDEKVPISTHGHARRQLAGFFPGRFMSWLDAVPQQLRTGHTILPTNNDGRPSHFSTDTFTTTLHTKQSLIGYLQRTVGNVFTTNGIRCDLSDSSTAFGQFVNMGCIGLKLSEEHGPTLVERISQHAREFSAYTEEPPRDRKLGAEEPQQTPGRGLDERQKRLLEGATRGVTKHLQKLKRTFRLYMAQKPSTRPGEPSRLFRTIEMIEPNRVRWVKAQMEKRKESTGERRRQLRDEMQGEIGLPLGFCRGEDMYPCPSGSCVPFADRDLCPSVEEVSAEPGVVQKLNQLLHDISLYDVDPERFLDDTFECYNGYRENPDLVPVTHTNLETKGKYADFCVGYTPYIDYRFPKPEVKGINRFIDTACNLEDGVNHCMCSWYYETTLAYSAFTFSYITVDVEYHLRNAFLVAHTIMYAVVFQWPVFDPLRAVWENLWPHTMPDWFRYFFSHLGVHQVTFGQRLWCAALNSASLFRFFFMVLMVLVFWPGAAVFHNWFLAITVDKRYMKLQQIKFGGVEVMVGDKKKS
jgi:hypothetical protein